MNNTTTITPARKMLRGSLLISSVAAAACFLGMTAGPVAAATEFQGNLNSVAITDAAGTNKAPMASVKQTSDGSSVTLDAGGSSDPDGTIASYDWKFSDGTVMQGAVVTYLPTTQPADTSATLTLTDDGGAVSLHYVKYSLTSPLNLAVNFQPSTSSVPTGFEKDSGGAYSDSVGYGWSVGPGTSYPPRDRNNSLSLDQSYDTFVHCASTAKWEAKVPNGTYKVTVTMGDPTYPDSTQGLQIEGISAINAEPLSATVLWITREKTVSVADGKLTLTFNTATVGKINWVKIVSQ